jgi:hypothetical protein
MMAQVVGPTDLAPALEVDLDAAGVLVEGPSISINLPSAHGGAMAEAPSRSAHVEAA